jgi:hypothetical protein
MTNTANQMFPGPGRFRRALAGIWAFLKAMESGPSGYTFDRMEGFEREVGRPREEMRQVRSTLPVDSHNGSASGLNVDGTG